MLYIVLRAGEIAQARGLASLPVVINLSYGNFAGPHDGTGSLEALIDYFVTNYAQLPLRVVLPAGNSYLLRTHAQVLFQNPTDVASLQWRVLPDGQTPSYLEIWLPPSGGGPPRLSVTITAPTGQALTIDEFAPMPQQLPYCEVGYYPHPASSRGMFLVTVNPTSDLNPSAALAPAGIWQVDIQNKILGVNDIVHAWVQRDDSLYGFPIRGRQSFFDNACYKPFDNAGRDYERDDPTTCFVRRVATINAYATGQSPIVIGGYLRKETVAAKYSSSGPASNPPRPDAMLVSEDSRIHKGVLAAGSRSGSVVAMGGTSVAAPQLARLIADDLAVGGQGDRATVQGWAMADDPGPPPPPPAPLPLFGDRYGAGRIKRPPHPHVLMQRYWGQY
jgi:hypothetical protein